jgi:hypothetical protein
MNQILATSNNNDNTKAEKTVKPEKQFVNNDSFDFNSLNTYSDDLGDKKSAKTDNKKIIIIFAIAIAVFGIILVAVAAANINKNKQTNVAASKKPEVTITEDGEQAKIAVTSQIGLNKITYYWDENNIQEANGNSSKEYNQSVDIPNGSSKLVVKAIDNNGQITEASKDFQKDGDSAEPVIEKPQDLGNGKVKIVAKDETSLSYITYKWEDGEEKKVEAQNEGDTTIEVEIDAARGDQKLYITAVDTSGNEANEEFTVKGVINPTIEFKKNGGIVYVRVSHDSGIKEVVFTLNGEEIYKYNESSQEYDATNKAPDFNINLKEGDNIITVTATSLEQGNDGEYTQTTESRQCTYTPQ